MRPRVIAVTGTPGTGKTALARELSLLLRYRRVDVHKLALSLSRKSGGMGKSENYDSIRRTMVVDIRQLNSVLISLIKAEKKASGLIIDSHMSHFLPSRYVDLCVVATCSLRTLKRRLEDRHYDVRKVRENLDAEVFETCLVEAQEAGHGVFVVDTTRRSPRSTALSVCRAAGLL
ncbi:AAA family ATPase [Candidatus Woesearchaeota archaeon]|nr:AAA family ATPase [Candidatus Woesearchaeota archaeon]